MDPRIAPIEKPRSLVFKLVYWYFKWKIGKVITPIKVIYARMPECLKAVYSIKRTEQKLKLSSRLKLMIKWYVAMQNGCAFCTDLTKFEMQENKVDPSLLKELIDYQSSNKLSDAEKAVLHYVEEVTNRKKVDDKVFTNLQNYYSDEAIVRITWLNAIENYYNLMGIPLRLQSDNLCKKH